tara:strand:- start:2955 stop:4121 length:1167 start_codon:yes stop_codon:yes gene_type:complete
MKMSHSKWKYGDYKKLNHIAHLIAQNIEEIYQYFDIDYQINEKMIISSCCIHGGDNKTALNFYHNSDFKYHFKCRTHGCEDHFKDTAIGFVRGALSHAKYGWEKVGDKEVTFNETVEFLLDRFDLKWEGIKKTEGFKLDKGNSEFCKVIENLEPKKIVGTYSKEEYRKCVQIPADYYLKRGYSIEVLDDYDIGTCKTYGKPLYNRAVVPVYDDQGHLIIGFSGRSIFGQCKSCKNWHDPQKKCHIFPKWRHTKGFQRDKTLYNYHRAKEHIQKSGTVILVESPGNVWRLEESGIHNSLAIFGTSFSAYQKQLIDATGALTLIILMDNDENGAGQAAAQKIKKQCENTYRVYIISTDKNDIGEMSTHEISQDIEPLINETMKVYEDVII